MDKMPDIRTPLRIVLEHKTGRLAGMFQIQGVTGGDDVPDPLPTLVDGIERRDGSVITAGMVRQHRGGIYYREVAQPEGLGRFHKEQR
jgi:hypothetical protein